MTPSEDPFDTPLIEASDHIEAKNDPPLGMDINQSFFAFHSYSACFLCSLSTNNLHDLAQRKNLRGL